MSDEDALLAAIAADPDEDTPRLAYADWLDEHDRPIRAEFIRVQIDISHKELLPRGEQDRYVDVWKRNEELLQYHRREVLLRFGWQADRDDVVFHRGFISELRVNPGEFWENQRVYAGLQPLPRIVVVGGPYAIREFLGFDSRDPHLDTQAHIVTVIRTNGSLLDNDTPYPDRLIEPLVWNRLNELDISGLRLGNEQTHALLQSSAFPALSDFDLSNNDLTDAAIMPFLRSGLPRQIKRLILGGNPLSDFGVRLLAEQWPTGNDDRLEHLNLRITNIGPLGQQALLARFGGRIDLF